MAIISRKALASLIAVMALAARVTHAQDGSPTMADLESLLAERDAAIIELQHTVRALLNRVDMLERGAAGPVLDPEAEDPRPATVPNGSTRAPDADPTRLEVDEAAAERALERTLVQTGALLLPRGRIELIPTLTHTVIESSFPVTLDVDDLAVDSVSTRRRVAGLDVAMRFGLPGDSQLEIGLPYFSVDEETTFAAAGSPVADFNSSGRGTGDFRLGIAKTLLRENGWKPDIVGRASYGFGNGDQTADGLLLGSGFEYFNASLAFVKRLDPLALFFSIGYTNPKQEDGLRPGDIYSVSAGTALAVSPESSLFGSVTYYSFSKSEANGLAVAGSDRSAASVDLGLSTILQRGRLLNVFTQIGLSDMAPDYALGFSMPMRWQ